MTDQLSVTPSPPPSPQVGRGSAPSVRHPHASISPGRLSSKGRWVPALLLAPCLTWIAFFFLTPLALMCWRSLASEGFSLEPYATLFTSPLYTKVMLTTVRAAAVATVGALVLGYPIAYALAVAGGKLRALILVFVLIPY